MCALGSAPALIYTKGNKPFERRAIHSCFSPSTYYPAPGWDCELLVRADVQQAPRQ